MSRDVAAAKRPAEAGSLFADGVTVRFGAISALESVSLQLAPREILGTKVLRTVVGGKTVYSAAN